MSWQVNAASGGSACLSSSVHCSTVKGHVSTKPGNCPSNLVSARPHPHTFYRQVKFVLLLFSSLYLLVFIICLIVFFFLQPSFTFSYYGRVGSQRYRLRRNAPLSLRPLTASRSLNDLSDLQRYADRRELQLSASSLSSEGSSSDGEPDRGTTVRLLWLSMLKVKLISFAFILQHLQ